MRTLLYTVAVGDSVFGDMARELVFSARKHGYEGDFLVLTDGDMVLDGARCLRIETAPDRLAKAELIRVLDRAAIAGYDKILYLDADCVFKGAPEALLECPGLHFATETSDPIPGYNTIFFSAPEKQRFRQQAVPRLNTGTILMPGTMAAGFLEAWEAFWLHCPRAEVSQRASWRWCNPARMDQPAMQLMLFRSRFPWEPFPPGAIGFPVYEREPGNVRLLHFCGPLNGGKTSHRENKEILLDRMRAENARD